MRFFGWATLSTVIFGALLTLAHVPGTSALEPGLHTRDVTPWGTEVAATIPDCQEAPTARFCWTAPPPRCTRDRWNFGCEGFQVTGCRGLRFDY